MRRHAAWFALLLLAAPALAEAPDPAYEAWLDSTLSAKSPAADSIFRLANRASNENKHDLASDLYGQVVALVPDFYTAYRRQAYEEQWVGRHARALTIIDTLIAREHDPLNLLIKAQTLMDVPADQVIPPAVLAEARRLVDTFTTHRPDDPYPWHVAWKIGASSRDQAYMRYAARQLTRLAPGDWQSWSKMTMTELLADRIDAAEAALGHAKALHMPAEVANGLENAIAQARSRDTRNTVLWAFVWALVVWAVAFAILSVAGLSLSRRTLAAASQPVTTRTGEATGDDARLRGVYRIVLQLCCALFYASIPLLLIVVLGIGGGLVYAGFAFGHVPIKLIFFILVITVVTAWSIVRSLIAFRRDEDPGEPVDLAQQPALRQVLDRVAEKIGTRPVDDVFLTPGTEIAVFERGGLREQLGGGARRCLILGIGVLDGMTVGQLKSILAHEYGHFSNRDTAGGGVALSVRRSVTLMALHLARGGAAAWYNPAWWFVRGFHALFLRISQGASRLQEVLADRWAAFAYGSAAFAAGFTHVIAASVRFNAQANAAVRDALEKSRPLPNLYRFRSNELAAETAIQEQIDAAMREEPSPYDSHPAPAQRLAWVAALDAPAQPDPGDDASAWSLLAEREELEKFMTSQIRDGVTAEHGVQFMDDAAESTATQDTTSPAT